MSGRKRRNMKHQYMYDVLVDDWFLEVSFNDYAYSNIFNLEEFEERFYLVLEGRISFTMSKKCKKDMAAKVVVHPRNFWDEKRRQEDGEHRIGHMDIQKANDSLDIEDTLYLRVGVPTKSYENIKDYLIYKGKALVTLVGTELYRRNGDIYYIHFRKPDD